MPRKTKFSPVWVWENKRYHDVRLDFPYSIIHRVGDTGYLSGGLSSTLAEWCDFNDAESFIYFIAVLMQSKVLIPVHFLPSFGRPNGMGIMHAKRGEMDAPYEYMDIGAVDLVPVTIEIEDMHQRFLAVFTSLREISQSPVLVLKNSPVPLLPNPEYTYLYIEFRLVYEWIKKHRTDIDCIAFDLLGQYFTSVDIDKFIEIVHDLHCAEMGYKGKNLIHDLRMASLNKHLPKSRKNKKG